MFRQRWSAASHANSIYVRSLTFLRGTGFLLAAGLALTQPALGAQARQSSEASPAPSKEKGARVVCKRTLRTGTLSSFERTCMTATEWAKQSEAQKQVYEEVQGRKGASVCSSTGTGSAGPDSGIAGASAPGC
jgi:hypothetical protein